MITTHLLSLTVTALSHTFQVAPTLASFSPFLSIFSWRLLVPVRHVASLVFRRALACRSDKHLVMESKKRSAFAVNCRVSSSCSSDHHVP